MRSFRRTRPSLLITLIGYTLLAGFVALADMRVIAMLMPREFVLSARVADGVISREPVWRVYQSRVLSPELVRLIGEGGDPARAYALFATLTLFLTGLSLLVLVRRLQDPARRPVPVFLAFHLTVLLLLPGLWIYPWDLFSLLAFAWFNVLALQGGPLAAMTVLFAVALPNHEIALAMAAWMLLDPVVRWLAGARAGESAKFDRRRFAIGVMMAVAGSGIVEAMRMALLVRETGPVGDLPPLVRYGRDAHFTLWQNLSSIGASWSLDPASGYQAVVPVFLIAVAVIALLMLLRDPVRHGALALTTLAMLAAILCFGLVFETRVLMPLVPFVALHARTAFTRAAAVRLEPQRSSRLRDGEGASAA